ncbi:MAG: hypothetical protein QME81_01675 [bacterium]|nr:hypothetical protein [bacterium]
MWQGKVAEAFGISRQWTNHYKRALEREGMTEVVNLEHKKWKLTEKVIKRIEEILVMNWHTTELEIARQLVTEGLVKQISRGGIREALKQIDLLRIRQKMRQMIKRGEIDQGQVSEWMVTKLMDILQEALEERGKQDVKIEEFGRIHQMWEQMKPKREVSMS